MLRPVRNPDEASALIAMVLGAIEASDRRAESDRIDAFTALVALAPRKPKGLSDMGVLAAYRFTPGEASVYGILRAKHGLSQEKATEMVLRSRRAAPGYQPSNTPPGAP